MEFRIFLKFEGLSVWEDEALRSLQGTYPVISLSLESDEVKEPIYELALTNLEVLFMFRSMVKGWFSEAEPERFYHGFVLGLMVELADRYVITSNRESGFGRYDILLEPKCTDKSRSGYKDTSSDNYLVTDAIIIEFKVREADEEATLQDTVAAALKQIEDKCYA